ncbi:MAG TPA: hypothetical protein VMV29_20235 [Ktedonobacterales bacterium]|nr:hypothetical protein [Ktedonobacterales bacterium]
MKDYNVINTADNEDYPDPWDGFRGAFQAPYPDLTVNHDYYIGEAALDPHEPKEPCISSDAPER